MGHHCPSISSKVARPINMQGSDTKCLSLFSKPISLLWEGRGNDPFSPVPSSAPAMSQSWDALANVLRVSAQVRAHHSIPSWSFLPRLRATPGGRTSWNHHKTPVLKHLNSTAYRLAIKTQECLAQNCPIFSSNYFREIYNSDYLK